MRDRDRHGAPAATVPSPPTKLPPRSASTPRRGQVVAWALCLAGLASGRAAPEPAFDPVTIAADVAIGYGVAVADVDGDRRPDILLADQRQFVWFRNPGWERFVLAEDLTETDNVCLAAADLDGDGRAEIAVGAGWNPSDTTDSGAVFYLIAPSDRTQRWTPVRLPHEPTVHRMRWVRNPRDTYDLVVLPLHGRGNQKGEGAGVRVLAYGRPAGPTSPWPTVLIDDRLHLTHNFDVVPGSQHSGEDLLVAAREGVFHFRSEGDRWRREQRIGNDEGKTAFTGAGEVRQGRRRSGPFIATIEPMHGHQVVVYTPAAADDPSPLWRRTVLDESLIQGHALACGDLLGLGADQIVVGWRGNRPGDRVGIKLFVSLDDAGAVWKSFPVDENQMACEDLCLADLDGDGRLDIVASGRATRNLKVYFNRTAGGGN
ncbi:MAG: VCBS repeat-containing protein [Verrucomicrobiales bacterium]|nr:VCBS repeat-containing protein [Verrucomicrobiales bacterium]